jgi:hypothetical protein
MVYVMVEDVGCSVRSVWTGGEVSWWKNVDMVLRWRIVLLCDR